MSDESSGRLSEHQTQNPEVTQAPLFPPLPSPRRAALSAVAVPVRLVGFLFRHTRHGESTPHSAMLRALDPQSFDYDPQYDAYRTKKVSRRLSLLQAPGAPLYASFYFLRCARRLCETGGAEARSDAARKLVDSELDLPLTTLLLFPR